jgi:peptidoglycan/xylan/chitin deacetylase (PgdA/CDA1 family)
MAAAYDRMHPPERGIVVLAYHRIGRRSSLSVDLPVWLFEEQMARLVDGLHVVSLDAAIASLHGPSPSGPDPVVITFDDGTADFVEIALPVLVRYQVPATLYVATAFVEEGRPFPHAGRAASWPALADAVRTELVTVGSHSHEHCLFDRIDATRAADDLDRSIQLIGERLGLEARHFAYPKALVGNPASEEQVRARFTSAALGGTAPNPYGGTDPYRLARSPIQVQDGLAFFDRKVRGGLALEDAARRLLAKRRFATSTS